MKKVLIAPPLYGEKLEEFSRRVQEKCAGLDAEYITWPQDEVTEEQIADINAVIGAVSPELFPAAKKLEFINLTSAGADSHAKAADENLILCNCAGAYGTSVSEWMLAATMAIIRHFDIYINRQREKIWCTGKKVISVENSTVLILGIGDIGSRYARAVKALGAYTIGVRKTDRAKPFYLDEQYTIDKLPEIIGKADIIAMVLPGGEQTAHLIDSDMLKLCKNGVYFINAGRGNAIDPAALKEGLKSGKIAGAALDVTEPEPLPADDELWTMENVIITPHIAGWFFLEKTFDDVIEITANNLRAYLRGEATDHNVDKKAGY